MSLERKHLGILIKNLPPLHDLEYRAVFSLHENTFFQKLVAKDVIEKVRIKPVDYFKALVFLDFFSGVIAADYSPCQTLEDLSKLMRIEEKKQAKEEGREPPEEEDSISYLGLKTVVTEAGLWMNERAIKLNTELVNKKLIADIKKRYDQEPVIDFTSPSTRASEPFYEGIGELVVNLASEPMRKYLVNTSRRADIGAIVFSEYVMQFFGDKKYSPQIMALLNAKDYIGATTLSLKQLVKGTL